MEPSDAPRAASKSSRPCSVESAAIPERDRRVQINVTRGHPSSHWPLRPLPPGQRGPRTSPRRWRYEANASKEIICRRIVALAGVAEGSRGRGEQHEHRKVECSVSSWRCHAPIRLAPSTTIKSL